MLASAKGFWMTILIIFLIYFAFKFIWRYFGPRIIRFVLRKAGKQMEKKFGENGGFGTRDTFEKTNIDYKAPNQRASEKEDTGEYIDYEEID